MLEGEREITFEDIQTIFDKIPPVPEGLLCEAEFCSGQEPEQPRPPAHSPWVKYMDGHACYIYVCAVCAEEEGEWDDGYPTNEAGEPVEPVRCS